LFPDKKFQHLKKVKHMWKNWVSKLESESKRSQNWAR